jgi:2-hydroxychromene-2-carboxylate isomerase
MRGALWAKQLGRLDAWDEAFFKAGWGQGRDIGDLETVKSIAAAAGFDPEAFAGAIQTDEIKKALIDATAEAAAAGAFGAPTFVVDGVLHWGQDRLEWIEAALAKR